LIQSRLNAALALLVAVTALGCGSSVPESPVPGAKREPAPPLRVAVIVLENREYGEIIGSAEAPFLSRLARGGVLATRFYGVAHPSLPNYLALIGGSTFGIEENCTDCSARGDNLAAQLSRAGLSWRAYMEDMPEACYDGSEHDGYAKRHDPFMYFPSISSVPGRCENVVPATQLDEDLHDDSLPAFSWVSPDLCNDAHDCSLGVADRWLSGLVPRITHRLGQDGILIVTFDEGTSDLGCCGGSRGGRIMTLLTGPGALRGVRLDRPFDHYSLLATIEDRFGLPRLRNARGVPTLHQAVKGQ
jgi:hypothetical protein